MLEVLHALAAVLGVDAGQLEKIREVKERVSAAASRTGSSGPATADANR
ncbi:hypothetical protein ACFYWY_15975 [Streptomyces sp. NPDC002870]